MGIFFFLGIILFVLAVIALWKRRPYAERMSLLRKAVPASATDVASAYPGETVALTGIARHEQPLVSEQTQTPCIYYDFEVVRHFERRRNVLPVGSRDRHRRRPMRRHEKVAENTQWAPFMIEDRTGSARVVPDGAEFEPRKVLDHYEPEGGNNPFGIPGLNLDFGIGWGDHTLGHNIKENLIPTDSQVFVLGTVDDRGQIARRNGNPMIVTHRSEAALREEWGKKEKGQLWGALIAFGLSMIAFLIAGVQWIISLV